MKQVTKLLINDFKIKKLGFDFMGYKINKNSSLSFHHLIIPHRECKKYGLGEGYLRWNGAILNQETSHDYLHNIIEKFDEEIFYRITSEMIDENLKGYLDINNIKRIHDLLNYFEKEHINERTNKGKKLIKEEYKKINRIRL